MKIAVAGKVTDTVNYVRYIENAGILPVVTLDAGEISRCDGLLLPGGGDITPAFFGEQNKGSRNIDTELDLLQLQAFDAAVRNRMPVLGICKGMQIINVALSGNLIQDLDPSATVRHSYDEGDRYHPSVISQGSLLHDAYGDEAIVNSAHHQALSRLGRGLTVIQRCPEDDCIEAVAHRALPIIGIQWHPERIDKEKSGTDGGKVLEIFSRLLQRESMGNQLRRRN